MISLLGCVEYPFVSIKFIALFICDILLLNVAGSSKKNSSVNDCKYSIKS